MRNPIYEPQTAQHTYPLRARTHTPSAQTHTHMFAYPTALFHIRGPYSNDMSEKGKLCGGWGSVATDGFETHVDFKTHNVLSINSTYYAFVLRRQVASTQ